MRSGAGVAEQARQLQTDVAALDRAASVLCSKTAFGGDALKRVELGDRGKCTRLPASHLVAFAGCHGDPPVCVAPGWALRK